MQNAEGDHGWTERPEIEDEKGVALSRDGSMKHYALCVFLITALAVAVPAAAQYNGVPQSGMMTKGDKPAGITPDELKQVEFEQRLG